MTFAELKDRLLQIVRERIMRNRKPYQIRNNESIQGYAVFENTVPPQFIESSHCMDMLYFAKNIYGEENLLFVQCSDEVVNKIWRIHGNLTVGIRNGKAIIVENQCKG